MDYSIIKSNNKSICDFSILQSDYNFVTVQRFSIYCIYFKIPASFLIYFFVAVL
nr:MAG TPA: hypothetical protein [Caudoviricetes sp.]